MLRVVKLLGIGAALVVLALAAGNIGQVGMAQGDCSITISWTQTGTLNGRPVSGYLARKMQDAVSKVAENGTICITEGIYVAEDDDTPGLWGPTTIDKPIVIKGIGRVIIFAQWMWPAFSVNSTNRDITVKIENIYFACFECPRVIIQIAIYESDEIREACYKKLACPMVARVTGRAKLILKNVTISGPGLGAVGVGAGGSLEMEGVKIWNDPDIFQMIGISPRIPFTIGIYAYQAGNITLKDTVITVNINGGRHYFFPVLDIREANTVTLSSVVIGPACKGADVNASSQINITNITVRDIGHHTDTCDFSYIGVLSSSGLIVGGSATVVVQDVNISNTEAWGFTVKLKKCGFDTDSFTGQLNINNLNIRGANLSGRYGEKCLP